MNKKQKAGRRGGLATLSRHGPAHFQKIGKRGAAVFWQRYRLEPFGQNDFAIVERQTNKIKTFLFGPG